MRRAASRCRRRRRRLPAHRARTRLRRKAPRGHRRAVRARSPRRGPAGRGAAGRCDGHSIPQKRRVVARVCAAGQCHHRRGDRSARQDGRRPGRRRASPACTSSRPARRWPAIFVRGLTGNKVNIFVDGVRYSNGAQRGGVNTFLDLIDPGALDTIEILRGPSSAQYGSDALGGSVQFLTKPPALGTAGRPRFGGSVSGRRTARAHRFGRQLRVVCGLHAGHRSGSRARSAAAARADQARRWHRLTRGRHAIPRRAVRSG